MQCPRMPEGPLPVLEVHDSRDGLTVQRIKLLGKKGALDSLARHLGLFDDNQALQNARPVGELSNVELIDIIVRGPQ